MTLKRFPKTQRVRVVHENQTFFTTASAIRNGVTSHYAFDAAMQKALEAIEHTRSYGGPAEKACVGLAGTWEGVSLQLDIVK
jgi:hypothetical protein